MRAASIVSCSLLLGCGYPEFAFAPDGGEVGVDTAVIDTTTIEETETILPDARVDALPDTAVVDTAPAVDACATCPAIDMCSSGVCRPYASCAALRAAHPTLGSGVYTIDPDGAGSVAPFATYCDMVEDGGGWTLALKADGAKKTFVYTAALWTNSEPLNASSTALDTNEAKLPSFWTVPFTAIRAGMLDGGTRRFLRINLVGTSLRATFAGPTIGTSAGRTEWMKILSDPRLQASCGAEGINRDFTVTGEPFSARARLGVFGNNEADCLSPDSYIAFGGGFVMPHSCVGPDPGIVVGNFNPLSCGGSAGNDRATATFGYLFIR